MHLQQRWSATAVRKMEASGRAPSSLGAASMCRSAARLQSGSDALVVRPWRSTDRPLPTSSWPVWLDQFAGGIPCLKIMGAMPQFTSISDAAQLGCRRRSNNL